MRLISRLERLEQRLRALAPPELPLVFTDEENARWKAFDDEVIRKHPEVAMITDLDERARVMAWYYDHQFEEDEADANDRFLVEVERKRSLLSASPPAESPSQAGGRYQRRLVS